MSGWIITIPVDGAITAQPLPDKEGLLDPLEAVVGGSIEIVPMFDRTDLRALIHDGLPAEVRLMLDRGWQDCKAYINEEGKLDGLPLNDRATRLWAGTLIMDGQLVPEPNGAVRMPDVLVGPLAVIITSAASVYPDPPRPEAEMDPAVRQALLDGSLLAIGQRYHGFEPGSIEGVQFFACFGDAPALFLFYSNVTAEEVVSFERAKMKLGLFAGKQAFFLLFSMPGFIEDDWGEAPYSVFRAHPDQRTLPPRQPNAGWLFKTVLIDSTTMVVRGLRVATVTPEFSQVLEDLMAEQRASEASWSEGRHRGHIERMRTLYPTPRAMAQEAEIVEPIGVSFDEAARMRTGRRFPINVDLYGPGGWRP